MNLWQPLQALDHTVEQDTEDSRAFHLEGRPQVRLGPAALLGDWLQRKEHGAGSEVGPRRDFIAASASELDPSRIDA